MVSEPNFCIYKNVFLNEHVYLRFTITIKWEYMWTIAVIKRQVK